MLLASVLSITIILNKALRVYFVIIFYDLFSQDIKMKKKVSS